MMRFMLAATTLSYAFTSVALSADVPVNSTATQPAPASAPPIYVKILLPVDAATPVIGRVQPVIESWIVESIDEDLRQANFRAVTGWVPLAKDPFDTTDLWDGGIGGAAHTCPVSADMTERKDGWVKISFQGWTPYGAKAVLVLKDEPGIREVVPVTQAETKHGVPHVAIFIGLPVK